MRKTKREKKITDISPDEFYHVLMSVAYDYHQEQEELLTQPPTAFCAVAKRFGFEYNSLSHHQQQRFKNFITNRWYSNSPFYACLLQYNEVSGSITITSKGLACFKKGQCRHPLINIRN